MRESELKFADFAFCVIISSSFFMSVLIFLFRNCDNILRFKLIDSVVRLNCSWVFMTKRFNARNNYS